MYHEQFSKKDQVKYGTAVFYLLHADSPAMSSVGMRAMRVMPWGMAGLFLPNLPHGIAHYNRMCEKFGVRPNEFEFSL
jgi:hypothetical protein